MNPTPGTKDPQLSTIYVTCRHTAIKDEGRVLLHLKDGPEEPEVVSVPKHKKHPPAGIKATTRTRVGPKAIFLSRMVHHAFLTPSHRTGKV